MERRLSDIGACEGLDDVEWLQTPACSVMPRPLWLTRRLDRMDLSCPNAHIVMFGSALCDNVGAFISSATIAGVVP
jgi:hypothetical protein